MINLQNLDLSFDGYSQNGEDEMLLSLRHVIGAPEFLSVVEFGASRGHDNSNTKLLVDNGAKGVFIEGNRRRFAQLAKEFANTPNALLINEWVALDSSSSKSLSNLVKSQGIQPSDVDIVSIDVDGDDYWHFKALDFRPSVVVIEFNPTMPSDSLYKNPRGQSYGSSPRAILKLGEDRGYFLGAMTNTNLLLLRSDRFASEIEEQDLSQLCLRVKNQIRFAVAYNGEVLRFSTTGTDLTAEVMDLGWSKGFLVQPLPRFLRKQSGGGLLERAIRRLLSAMASFIVPRPFSALKFIVSPRAVISSSQTGPTEGHTDLEAGDR